MKARYALLGLLLLAAAVLAQPTITVTPSTVSAGGTVEIKISGVDAEKCGIEIVDPAGAKAFVKEITLSNGQGVVTWDVPLAARLGAYTVYVSCTTSGAATAKFTVTALVGGEAHKDLAPLLMTMLSALAALLAAALIVRRLGGKLT